MFRAEVKGQALVFDTAGVIGGNEVFKDRQTGSRWQQSSLEAISGPLKGEPLRLFPFLLTNWHEWRKLHPETLVLKPLPGYDKRIPAMNAVINQGLSGQGEAPEGVLRRDSRLRPKAMVLGLTAGGANKAYPLPALRQARVINDHLGDQLVLIVHQPDSDTTTAFVAHARSRDLTFQAADDQVTAIIDQETHSRWNPYGLCLSGHLRGTQLEPLILEPEFWFAWSEFHPSTAIYQAAASGASR